MSAEENQLRFETLTKRLEGNDSSVFLSYGWDSPEHTAWVKKLADDLSDRGITVVLDRDLGFPDEAAAFTIALAMHCRHMVAVMSPRYAESNMLGLVEYDFEKRLSPSIAVEIGQYPGTDDELFQEVLAGVERLKGMAGREAHLEEALSGLPKHAILVALLAFLLQTQVWRVTGDFNSQRMSAMQLSALRQELREMAPRFPAQCRLFFDGWAFDEYSMFAMNAGYYSSMTTLFRSGTNCFVDWPVLNFCCDRDYNDSLGKLVGRIRAKRGHSGRDAQGSSERAVFAGENLPVGTVLWRKGDARLVVIRPSFAENSNLHGVLIQIHRDWERMHIRT